MQKKHKLSLCLSDIDEEHMDPCLNESLDTRKMHKFTEMLLHNQGYNKKQNIIISPSDNWSLIENELGLHLKLGRLNNIHKRLLEKYKTDYLNDQINDYRNDNTWKNIPRLKHHSVDIHKYTDVACHYKYYRLLYNAKKQAENNAQILWEWILSILPIMPNTYRNALIQILDILFEIKHANVFNIRMELCKYIMKIIELLENEFIKPNSQNLLTIDLSPNEHNLINDLNSDSSTTKIQEEYTPTTASLYNHNNTPFTNHSNFQAKTSNLKYSTSQFARPSPKSFIIINGSPSRINFKEIIKKLLLKIRFLLSTIGHLYQYYYGIIVRWEQEASDPLSNFEIKQNKKHLQKRIKKINQYCEKYANFGLKSTLIIKKLSDLENFLYENEVEIYSKWEKDYNNFWSLKLNRWKVGSATLRCKICEKEFKISDVEGHFAICKEIAENKSKLVSINNDLIKFCEKGFEYKKSLAAKTIIKKRIMKKPTTKIEDAHTRLPIPQLMNKSKSMYNPNMINGSEDLPEAINDGDEYISKKNMIDNIDDYSTINEKKSPKIIINLTPVSNDSTSTNLSNNNNKEEDRLREMHRSYTSNISNEMSNSNLNGYFPCHNQDLYHPQQHRNEDKNQKRKMNQLLEPSDIIKQKTIQNINQMRQNIYSKEPQKMNPMIQSAVFPSFKVSPGRNPNDVNNNNNTNNTNDEMIRMSIHILESIIKYGEKLECYEIDYHDSIQTKQEIEYYLNDKEYKIDNESRNILSEFLTKLEEKISLEASIFKQHKRGRIATQNIGQTQTQGLKSKEAFRNGILSGSMRVRRSTKIVDIKHGGSDNNIKSAYQEKDIKISLLDKEIPMNHSASVYIQSSSTQTPIQVNSIEKNSNSGSNPMKLSKLSNSSLGMNYDRKKSLNNQSQNQRDNNNMINCSDSGGDDPNHKNQINGYIQFNSRIHRNDLQRRKLSKNIEESPVLGIINAETTQKDPTNKNLVGISLFAVLSGKFNPDNKSSNEPKGHNNSKSTLINSTKAKLLNLEKALIVDSGNNANNINCVDSINHTNKKNIGIPNKLSPKENLSKFCKTPNQQHSIEHLDEKKEKSQNKTNSLSITPSKKKLSILIPSEKSESPNRPKQKQLKFDDLIVNTEELSSSSKVNKPKKSFNLLELAKSPKFNAFFENLANSSNSKNFPDKTNSKSGGNSNILTTNDSSGKICESFPKNDEFKVITTSNGLKFLQIRRDNDKKPESHTRLHNQNLVPSKSIFRSDKNVSPNNGSIHNDKSKINNSKVTSTPNLLHDKLFSKLKGLTQTSKANLDPNQNYLSPNLNHIGLMKPWKRPQIDINKNPLVSSFFDEKKLNSPNLAISRNVSKEKIEPFTVSLFSHQNIKSLNEEPKKNSLISNDVHNEDQLVDKIKINPRNEAESNLLNFEKETVANNSKNLSYSKDTITSLMNKRKKKNTKRVKSLNAKFISMVEEKDSLHVSHRIHGDLSLRGPELFEKSNYSREDNTHSNMHSNQVTSRNESNIINLENRSDIEAEDFFEQNKMSPQFSVSPYLKGYYSDSEAKNFAKSKRKTFEIGFVDFDFIKPIGKGAYGTVWLVRKKVTGDIYAMKIIDCSNQKDIQNYLREREVFSVLNGEYVVKAIWSFIANDYLCYVMEYMIGGDFGSILEKYSCLYEEMAKFYIAEIVLALEALHNIGIIHRDLKPENILLDSKGHIKLTDFGLSDCKVAMVNKAQKDSQKTRSNKKNAPNMITKFFSTDKKSSSDIENKVEFFKGDLKLAEKKAPQLLPESPGIRTSFKQSIDTDKDSKDKEKSLNDNNTNTNNKDKTLKVNNIRIIGTPDYIAPEIIKGKVYDEFIDWWSLGVLLYEFICGVPPFNDCTIPAIFDNILNLRINWPEIGYGDDCISPEAYDLITKLLAIEPQNRLKVQEIKSHPFFKGIDWDNIRVQPAPILPKFVGITDTSNFTRADIEEKKLLTPFLKEGKCSEKKALHNLDKDAFNLIRLDILHQLNQEQYQSLKAQLEKDEDYDVN